jgi:AcrR family transcriptional regulator
VTTAEPPVKGPQQDRSRATRLALLEAAVDCLAEVGWSGSTVTVVAERAGVSRGAAQHHFPTREDLFIAAVEHMTEARAEEIRRYIEAQGDRPISTQRVVELVVDMHTGELFQAALALWVASAAEPQLRERVVTLETRVGRQVHRATVQMLGVDDHKPGVRPLIQATLDMARGLGLANLLGDDRQRRAPIIAQWSALLDGALNRSA